MFRVDRAQDRDRGQQNVVHDPVHADHADQTGRTRGNRPFSPRGLNLDLDPGRGGDQPRTNRRGYADLLLAKKQSLVHAGFQRADPAADGRMGQAQQAGGPLERAGTGNGKEQYEGRPN